MKKSDIEARTKELLLPILEEGSYELWDVEYVKEGKDLYLRAYVDKKGGIMIDDCVEISRALEKKLDEEDFIPDAYILEVSSPGLTRPLKKTNDFVRSTGKRIELKLYKALSEGPFAGQKEIEVDLVWASDEMISVKEPDGDGAFEIKRDNIAKANLAFVDVVNDEDIDDEDIDDESIIDEDTEDEE